MVVPLAVPRRYVPVDPKNPLPEPNPEQTASIFSFITFAFLDSLVYAANRVTHLGFEKLPPLNDRDFAEHLKELSFKTCFLAHQKDIYSLDSCAFSVENILYLY